MVFHWRLSDRKSPQVSRTLLSILTVFNNAVVWMVATRPPTSKSKSSRPFNSPLVTVPKAPITIGIIVTFMFHSFFNSLARSRHSSLFSHFSFIFRSAGTAKSTILQFFFFFFFFVDYCKVWSFARDYYYYYYYYYDFHTSCSLHCISSDRKYPQLFRTFPSIRFDFKNAVDGLGTFPDSHFFSSLFQVLRDYYKSSISDWH